MAIVEVQTQNVVSTTIINNSTVIGFNKRIIVVWSSVGITIYEISTAAADYKIFKIQKLPFIPNWEVFINKKCTFDL